MNMLDMLGAVLGAPTDCPVHGASCPSILAVDAMKRARVRAIAAADALVSAAALVKQQIDKGGAGLDEALTLARRAATEAQSERIIYEQAMARIDAHEAAMAAPTHGVQ